MVSAEQKLQLVHFLREDNKRNRIQLHKREQILYGKEVPDVFYEENDFGQDFQEGYVSANKKDISGFRVRFIIAVVLFLSFFYLDSNDEKIGKINAAQIQEYIEDDSLGNLVANVFDFDT